jgi:hypothetical protein
VSCGSRERRLAQARVTALGVCSRGCVAVSTGLGHAQAFGNGVGRSQARVGRARSRDCPPGAFARESRSSTGPRCPGFGSSAIPDGRQGRAGPRGDDVRPSNLPGVAPNESEACRSQTRSCSGVASGSGLTLVWSMRQLNSSAGGAGAPRARTYGFDLRRDRMARGRKTDDAERRWRAA